MRLTKNKNLAELIGMYLGDGNLGNYPKYRKTKLSESRCQYLRIYCNIKEKQYIKEIYKVLNKVFNKKPYLYKRPKEGVVYLEISLKNLDLSLGFPIGDKIKNEVYIPNWIIKKESYLVSCLRGLFDTDGCCYLTGKKYLIINFTNKNQVLLKTIFKGLKLLGFCPYISGKRNVEIGRQDEVRKFFDKIKPRNRKHYRFLKAGVANLVKARV